MQCSFKKNNNARNWMFHDFNECHLCTKFVAVIYLKFITAQAETPVLISHADSSNYPTIWSADIIKCRSGTVYHKSDNTWLQGHSLCRLITSTLNLFLLFYFPSIPNFLSLQLLPFCPLPFFIYSLRLSQSTFILNFFSFFPSFPPFFF